MAISKDNWPESAETVQKVVAYITRFKDGGQQLLVFTHADYPDAGLQVPAGTIDPDESPEKAVLREVAEESGLTDVQIAAKLGVFSWYRPDNNQWHKRHVFHLVETGGAPDTWDWLETDGGKKSAHEGYRFSFRWEPLDAVPDLIADFGAYLHLLRGR